MWRDPFAKFYGEEVDFLYGHGWGKGKIRNRRLAPPDKQVPWGQFLYDKNGRLFARNSITNIILSENRPKIEDCFIATAVYGGPNAPQVQTLKEFRDDVLMQSSLGRALVSFYYSGAGEKAADFIKNHLPQAIPAIRRGLDSLVEKYSSARK